MPEPERLVSREDRRPMWADQLLPDEPRQRRGVPADLDQCAAPEFLADHGRTFRSDTLVRGKLLEPRCQQRLDRRRHDDIAAVPVLCDQRQHLLDEQRVALRGVGNSVAHRIGEAGAGQQVVDERLRLLLSERFQQRRCRVPLPAAPRRAYVEQLRPVSSPTRISPGCAACSSRAATFTSSPVASVPPSLVTTSPVLMPIRTCSSVSYSARSDEFRTPSSARKSSAARAARKASSSCTRGIPNTAITASPMNFSTLPPCRSS